MKRTLPGITVPLHHCSCWMRRLVAFVCIGALTAAASAQDLTVSTVASGFFTPYGVAVDSAGNAYVADTSNHVIRKVTFGGALSTLAGAIASPNFVNNVDPLQARFSFPRGIAINSSGTTLYVADTGNNAIRVISLSGVGGVAVNVTTLAGLGPLSPGSANSGATSTFNGPRGVALSPAGDVLYVADTGNHMIRSITIAGTTVATVAGTTSPGYVNGDGTTSRFNQPWGIAVASAGNALFVADSGNHVIRRVALGTVASTTYAGTASAGSGNNAIGTLAQFNTPAGVALDPAGNLFVGDFGNNAVRMVAAAGSNAVTTAAGGSSGSANGTGSGAQFSGPTGVAVANVSAVQYVYVADTNNHLLRRGTVSLVVGTAPTFPSPTVTFNGVPGFVSFANPAFGTTPITYSPTSVGVYSIDPSTGTITGNPTSAADNATFVVTASNGVLPNATRTVTISIGVTAGPTISTHPQPFVLSPGGSTAFFSVIATSTLPLTYQWERQVSGGAFAPIQDGGAGGITFNGTTSSSLTVSGITPLMNGDAYRVVVSHGSPATSTTSNSATVSVPPAFTSSSTANFAVNQGSNFLVVATGNPSPNISLTSGFPPTGITFIPGSGTATVTGSSSTFGSTVVSLTATNSGGTTTQFFTINVVNPQLPSVISQSNVTFVLNQPASFTFQGTGAPSPTFILSGPPLPPGLQFNSPLLSGTPLSVDNSPLTYQVTATNSSGSSSPQTFTITIQGVPPTITAQPVSVTANVGGTATFTSGASGSPAPTIRWQRQPSGTIGFVDLTESLNFTGTQTPTLTLNNIEAFMGGDQFRLLATNSNSSVNSIPATLTVNIGTTFTTFAGLAQFSGASDGTGSAARFNAPSSIATDFSGNVFIADTANHIIRKMTPAGVVTTIAGQPGITGSVDGFGASARFNSPQGVAVDAIGNVFVADTFNHTIRVISTSGNVSTLAGLAGNNGAVDDLGPAARFFQPTGIVVDNTGTVYVADSGNHAIRRVLPNGFVSTFAGAMGSAGFFDNPTGTLARFNAPNGLARDTSGNIYVADSFNHTIRKISLGGSVTTLAGAAGNPGITDGNSLTARFNRPYGVSVDLGGNVYVADTFSNTLRKISPTGDTITLAGLPGATGTTDGVGGQARFNQPYDVAADGAGNVYVADTRNHTIRRTGAPTPAQITTQPANRTAGVGGNVTFTVTATGAPNPGYQWQRQPANSFGFASLANDATYSGVNTATLTITNVTQAMAGDQFRVIVNNGVPPAVESSAATLAIGTPPVFTSPATANFQALQAGSFNVAVTSTPAATFSATGLPSWASINATTGQITGTPPDTSGSPFTVTITANNGITATQTLTLNVTAAPPSITTQPASTSVDQGGTATFTVAATGTPPFTYQWRRNGAPIAGATGTTLTLPGVQPSAAGLYSVTVSNSVGSVTSNGATLAVNSLPVITSQPGPQVAQAGGSATFSVAATGGSLVYQWRKNGVPIPAANGSSLVLNNIVAADAGNFDVQVSNNYGLVNSSLAQLTIASGPTAPVITAQPAARRVVAGSSVTFSVAATGVPSPTFQWRKNGVPIAGANTASHILSSVQAADAANYDVIVSNTVGNVTSSPAGLTILGRSFAGYYFGSFNNNLGDFAIYVRDDNTGVFLAFLTGSNAPVMTLNLQVNDAGEFSFAQGPVPGTTLQAINLGGTLNSNGTLSGSILGGANGTFGGERAPGLVGSQGIAGFYQAGAGNNAGIAYSIVGPNNVAFVVVQSGNVYDGGRGVVTNTGAVTVSTNRSVIAETVGSSGTISGTSSGAVTLSFSGGSDLVLANQRLVNISSRARVGAGDAVAIAGFVISGEVSKPVLIRAVGPTLGAAPFNVAGALASPRLELFRGNTSIAVNTGISGNRAAIDAAGQQAGAFALGASGADAALLTTLAPGNYTAIVNSATTATGVALIEVYDLSGVSPGQKLLNIATRAAAGTGADTLIAGFVVPPGASKRVLIRGVGPGLSIFGVTGVLAQPVLTLISGSNTVATNTNWSTSADSAVITGASAQAGAFPLANNDSAMVVTLAPGNYTAQVVGVNNTTGVALIEVYELP